MPLLLFIWRESIVFVTLNMIASDSNSNDIFGIRLFCEAAKILVDKFFDGLGAFLSSICLPACEEVGLLLRDQI